MRHPGSWIATAATGAAAVLAIVYLWPRSPSLTNFEYQFVLAGDCTPSSKFVDRSVEPRIVATYCARETVVTKDASGHWTIDRKINQTIAAMARGGQLGSVCFLEGLRNPKNDPDAVLAGCGPLLRADTEPKKDLDPS